MDNQISDLNKLRVKLLQLEEVNKKLTYVLEFILQEESDCYCDSMESEDSNAICCYCYGKKVLKEQSKGESA